MDETVTRRDCLARLAGLAGMAAALPAFGAGARAGTADPQVLSSVPTNLSSNAELMISYRHQDRMWQTADGGLHLIVNRGTLQPNPGLVLHSSYDGGVTWTPMQAMASTDRDNTADGQLAGSTLVVAYADQSGNVLVTRMAYDAGLRTWSSLGTELVFASPQFEAHNPTLGFDDAGALWVSFAAIDRSNANINLRLVCQPSAGAPWVDTGLIFGPTDNLSKERSARPVRVPGGMGMVYRVNQSTFWAARPNGAALDVAWSSVKIAEGAPQKAISDPYAAHYSVVAEGDGYLHVVVADDGDVQYLRYTVASDSWTPQRKVNGRKKASYIQIGMFEGQVAIGISAARGDGSILVSSDHGDTFGTLAQLLLPPDTTGVSYKTGRVEMPATISGTLPLLQQYEENRKQRLMLYRAARP